MDHGKVALLVTNRAEDLELKRLVFRAANNGHSLHTVYEAFKGEDAAVLMDALSSHFADQNAVLGAVLRR